jgi:hypothetical protein
MSLLVHKQAPLSLLPFQFCATLFSRRQYWLLEGHYSRYSIYIRHINLQGSAHKIA